MNEIDFKKLKFPLKCHYQYYCEGVVHVNEDDFLNYHAVYNDRNEKINKKTFPFYDYVQDGVIYENEKSKELIEEDKMNLFKAGKGEIHELKSLEYKFNNEIKDYFIEYQEKISLPMKILKLLRMHNFSQYEFESFYNDSDDYFKETAGAVFIFLSELIKQEKDKYYDLTEKYRKKYESMRSDVIEKYYTINRNLCEKVKHEKIKRDNLILLQNTGDKF